MPINPHFHLILITLSSLFLLPFLRHYQLPRQSPILRKVGIEKLHSRLQHHFQALSRYNTSLTKIAVLQLKLRLAQGLAQASLVVREGL
jgi:hypothetical protein